MNTTPQRPVIDDPKLNRLVTVYQFMKASRLSDETEAELVNSGEANFLASSKGHEGAAMLAPFLQPSDYLHCHYRDKALMLARGMSNEMFFYSALCKAESHSHGRQMVSHMSDPDHNIMSIVGPVGNNGLQATGAAQAIKDQPDAPIVLCAIGDGTSQQGEILEAIAQAARADLPVLFFIHNNNLAISTRTTGQTFFSRNPQDSQDRPDNFYGLPITYLDGVNALASMDQLGDVVSTMRHERTPQIVVMDVERLDNHSNADDQGLYRTTDELNQRQSNDPLVHAQNYLINAGVSKVQIQAIDQWVAHQVKQAVETARQGQQPTATMTAERPLPEHLQAHAPEKRGHAQEASKNYTLLEGMRAVFQHQLATNPDVCLLGEDIEDGKGDVFGVTRGLSTEFPNRVVNSPLSESTIVGSAAGMALTGKQPVAMIQFADFLPPAYNQIFSELATMYWRTNGQWQTPVIVTAPCGGYRPGLGPFHSQTNEATYAHIPGLDVYMPSNAADAVGLLNAAFQAKRPSLFLYPKKLLNNQNLADMTSTDVDQQLIPIGKARIVQPGDRMTLVGWGNTVEICQQVADEVAEQLDWDIEVIDLRTIKPYDRQTIVRSVEKTRHLMVVHEDNMTCGLGGEIIAMVQEKIQGLVHTARIAKPDTYTPCNFENQLEVLPSMDKVLTKVADMLEVELTWENIGDADETAHTVEVIGASPSDEQVMITDLHVAVGDTVKAGDKLVDLEASKSAGEILSPQSGVVETIYVEESQEATVGAPLLKLRLQAGTVSQQAQKQRPILTPRSRQQHDHTTANAPSLGAVGITQPVFQTGGQEIDNATLLDQFPDVSNDDIVARTGIQKRFWLAENETLLDLTTDVAEKALQNSGLTLQDIDMVLCATCSPEKYLSPSLACLTFERLCQRYETNHRAPALDINAACSGYLYALQTAQDYLATRPDQRILLITGESLSRRLRKDDFATAFLFGDGATATIVQGQDHLKDCVATIDGLTLSNIPDDGSTLNVPAETIPAEIGITLKGQKLFTLAVKNMATLVKKCCQDNDVDLQSVDLVIPHQANQRISDAVQKRLNLPAVMYSNIAKFGNTSSCTIPIGLADTLSHYQSGQRVALCAFGAGLTAGAGLLKIL